jgi:formate hydrogenlyase subunit 3/multisubunit Na+/H+ antiporter MnhD subunit
MALAELDGALFLAAIWGLAAAALLVALPFLPARGPLAPGARAALARGVAIGASLALAAVGALGLAGIFPAPIRWWPGLPGDPFTLGVDALVAPFLLLLGVVAAVSFVPRQAAVTLGLHSAFALALAAALASQHALLFLLAWEGMTLLCAALVASDTRSARARRAAYVHLALAHLGAAAIGLGVMRLASLAGSFAFGDLALAFTRLAPGDSATIVWLVTAGFAVTLGLAPLHVWLPLAHPEAPAPVAALLSGAMVKAGLYGLLRFAWQMPGVPPAGWGVGLALLGTFSALVGALYAVVEPDAKRLLAYSTVKHAGLLALSLGIAATLLRAGHVPLAGVALTACLYHLVGHGLSKGLAFLSVGAAVDAAGRRDLEKLGGLARRLPRLSVSALVATLALCGLPPLACFAGEWLLFQALILGFSAGSGSLRLLVPFSGAGLALATALSAAALVKLYGIGFLGRPRTVEAAGAHPAGRGLEWSLLALAAAGILWGVGSPWAIRALASPIAAVLGGGFEAASLAGLGGLALAIPPRTFASVSPLSVTVLIALFAALPLAWAAVRGPHAPVRRAPSWACGTTLDPRTQYSALGFTKPLRLIFEPVLRQEHELEVLEEGSRYFARKHRYRTGVPRLVERVVFQPFVQSVLWTSDQARRLQSGNLHLDLAYLLVTLVALLVFAR